VWNTFASTVSNRLRACRSCRSASRRNTQYRHLSVGRCEPGLSADSHIEWAACGQSVRVPSGSPAVNAAKPSGTPIAQVAPRDMPRICFSFNAGQWVARPVCPAAQAANFGLLDLQLTEADRARACRRFDGTILSPSPGGHDQMARKPIDRRQKALNRCGDSSV